jgi:hypothetical protein
MISTGRFNSRATRVRIFSMSSRSPFQSQPFSVYRLIFSDSGGIDRDDPTLLAQFNCQEAAYYRIIGRGGR